MRRSCAYALRVRPGGIPLPALALAVCLAGCTAPSRSTTRTAHVSPVFQPIPSATHDATPTARTHAAEVLFGDDEPSSTPPPETVDVRPAPGDLTQHTFTVDGRDFDPDVTRDGNTLAFASTRDARHPDIYLQHAGQRGPVRLAPHPADDVQPRFSPDGRRVAFASNRSGNWDIWIVALDAPEPVPFTHDRGDQIAPAWSPSGEQIAYTYWNPRTRQWEIWCQSTDGPGVPAFVAVGMFPAWSPDGRRIAFQRARDRGQRLFSLWTVEFDGHTPGALVELVSHDTAACIAPAWSPTGDELAFCRVGRPTRAGSSADSRSTLGIVDMRSGSERTVLDAATRTANPVWCTAGRMYFVSDRAGAENIWSIGAPPTGGDQPPTTAPDEQSLPPIAEVVAAQTPDATPPPAGGTP